MAKLPAIRTEGASPFARRSRMPAGSFDELLAPRGSISEQPVRKSLRRPAGLRKPLRDKDVAVAKASEQLQNNRQRRKEYKKLHSGSMRDEKACVVKSLSLTGGTDGLDAMAAGCLLPQLAATPQCFRYLQNLNMSGTRINAQGVKSLATFLASGEDCHVKSLRLDKCGVSDASSALLFRGVERARCLKVLSIAKNRVGPKGSVALAKSIRSTHLKEVSLSGNALHGLSLGFLCEALAYTTTIHRLDLSWNLLGKCTDEQDYGRGGDAPPAIRALALMLATNRHLRALNLANCSLDLTAIETIGEGLRENTSLISLKVNDGNCGKLDAKMFLESETPLMLGEKKQVDRGHRWSEPGYREVEFMFSPSSCAQFDPSRPLYLHLECDHWQADPLDLMEPFGFVRFRVLPPGKQYYFFSQGESVLIADDHASDIHPKVHSRRNFIETSPGHLLKSVHDLDHARPRDRDWADLEQTPWLVGKCPSWSMQHAFVGRHRQLSDAEKGDLKKTKADPRLFDVQAPERFGKTSQQACVFDPDSVFRDYELFDSPGRCHAASFEDWTDMKLTRLRLVPESDEKTALDGLRNHYVLLSALFQHLRCIEYPNHRTELKDHVDLPTMLKLLTRTGLVVPSTRVQTPHVSPGGAKAYKGKVKKRNARKKSLGVEHSPDPIDTKSLRELFYIVNVSFEEHMADPDEKELLDRGEFVELLCRLALLRYADPHEPDGLELPAALDSLIENHIGPYVDHLAQSSSLTPSTIGRNDGFRIKFFYTPEADAVLTKYETQLRRIFRDYACGQHSKDPFGAEEKRRQKLLHKKPKKPELDIFGQEIEDEEIVCQVPKIDFADLLELVVRTGALDVDYLRPKKQPPADGLGRGQVTEYEILQDAIKSELLSIDDKGSAAQNASLDFGEFLEFVCRHVWRLHCLEGATHEKGLAHYHSRLDHWIEALCDILYFEDSHAELRARYVRGALPPTPQESSRSQPQLLAQASAVSVAAKLASKIRGRKSSIDSWAFAPPDEDYDDDDDEEEEEAAPEKPAAPPRQVPRKAAKRQTKKKHAYQTNPYALPAGPLRKTRKDKPRRKKERDGPATFEGFFADGDAMPPHSPIRTPNRPSLDGPPAASDPRTPGGGLKEEYLDDEEEDDEEEYEEEYDSQPLTAAADPRTPGGGLKTLSEEEFEDEEDMEEELSLTPAKPITAAADPRTPGGGLRSAEESYEESYEED